MLFIANENRIGGATRSLCELICGIKENIGIAIKIDVLIPRARKIHQDAKKYLEAKEIPCIELYYKGNYRSSDKWKIWQSGVENLINCYATFKLVEIIRKNKYNIICSNSVSVDIGARAAEMIKVPHIYYIREFMEEDFGIEFRNKKRMKRLIENSMVNIFISKAIQEKYIKMYSIYNYAQFYNAFAVDNYYIEKHFILSDTRIHCLYIGKFLDGKGTMDLLKMFCRLVNSCDCNRSKYTLELAGYGGADYIERMESFIADNNLNNNIAVNKDILVMNSFNEGFGRVTVEGMLMGCLVLGRFCGGTKEILQDGINGICYDNSEDFIKRVEWIDKNRELARGIATEGQNWAKTRFDKKIVSRDFLSILNAIV